MTTLPGGEALCAQKWFPAARNVLVADALACEVVGDGPSPAPQGRCGLGLLTLCKVVKGPEETVPLYPPPVSLHQDKNDMYFLHKQQLQDPHPTDSAHGSQILRLLPEVDL